MENSLFAKCLRFFTLTALLAAAPVSAFEAGNFLVRLRGIHLWPNDSSGSVKPIPHSGVAVGSATAPELDFTYMLTCNWGTELILETSRHTITGRKDLSGTRVGKTWVLPPTLLLQYHFFPDCCYQPYLGLGANCTILYNEDSHLSHTKLKLSDPSWGIAYQGGVDIMLCQNWFLNFDVKYVNIDTEAKLKGDVNGKVHVDIDPWIFGIGIGRYF